MPVNILEVGDIPLPYVKSRDKLNMLIRVAR
jgi:hypothetical protein